MITQAQQKPMVARSGSSAGFVTTPRLVGALFLTAMVASLLGGSLVESVLSTPDTLVAIFENKAQLLAGILLELINAIAVLGIGVLMFPFLSRQSNAVARGYLGFRTIEAVFCSAIVIGPLALMILSRGAMQTGGLGAESAEAISALATAQRAAIVNLLIPIFFCLGAFLLYASAYQSRLFPRFLSVWGLIAVALVLLLNLSSLYFEFEMSVAMIFALPIILNEIFLGIWLIVKGFSSNTTIPAAQASH